MAVLLSGSAARHSSTGMAAAVSCTARASVPLPQVALCWPQWVASDQLHLLSWRRTKVYVGLRGFGGGVRFSSRLSLSLPPSKA